MSAQKLYLITRADLTPGQQAAQVAHVAIEMVSRQGAGAVSYWYEHSNTVAVLLARDECHLETLAARGVLRGCVVEAFREPDLNDAVTALAMLGAPASRICGDLPLLGA